MIRGLISFDQVTNPLRIGLAVTVTRNGIGPACGFNYDVGPENPGANMHGGNLHNADALLVAAE
jgi:hypothetical protein